MKRGRNGREREGVVSFKPRTAKTSWKQSTHPHTGKLKESETEGTLGGRSSNTRLRWDRQMCDSLTEMSNWQAENNEQLENLNE